MPGAYNEFAELAGSTLDTQGPHRVVVTDYMRTLLDDETAAQARTTLGIDTSVFQPLDATLTALGALTTAADKLIYATGSDTFSTTTLTSFARTVLDDVDAATARTTLGLVIGTDVQAWDPDLSALAAASSNGLWARTSSGVGAARSIQAGTGISVANGNGVAGDPTISVDAATQAEAFEGNSTDVITAAATRGGGNSVFGGMFKTMAKVAAWTSSSKAPIYMMQMGDSVSDVEGNGDWGLSERVGDAGYFNLWPQITGSAAQDTNQWSYWINGEIVRIPAGSTCYFDLNTASLPANKAFIAWIKESGGGTFDFQYSTNTSSPTDSGATWTSLATGLSASNASTIGAANSYSFTHSSTVRLRVTNVSGGTVRIVAAGAWDNTNGGRVLFRSAKGGMALDATAALTQAIAAPIIAAADLDCVFSLFANEGENTPYMTTLRAKLDANLSSGDKPDYVIIASQPDNTESVTHVAAWRQWAVQNGQAFVDLATPLKSYALASPYFYVDTIHLNSAGLAMQRSWVWSQLSLGNWLNRREFQLPVANNLVNIKPSRQTNDTVEFEPTTNTNVNYALKGNLYAYGANAGFVLCKQDATAGATWYGQTGWYFYVDSSNVLRIRDQNSGNNDLFSFSTGGNPFFFTDFSNVTLGTSAKRWGTVYTGSGGVDTTGPLVVGGAATVRAGTSSTYGKPVLVIAQLAAAVGNVGGGEDTLWSVSVLGNTLAANGDSLEIEIRGNVTAPSDETLIRFYWAGVQIGQQPSGGGGDADFWMKIIIQRTGSATQRIFTIGSSQSAEWTAPLFETGAATLSSNNTFLVTGESQGGITNEAILYYGSIKYVPA